MNTTATLETEFPTRLIPLSTGRPGLRTALPVEIREPAAVNPEPSSTHGTHDTHVTHAHCLDFISSDASLDRYQEIITPSGWRLETYLRNPVFQNAHQYGDIIFTLGRALLTELRSGPSTLNSQPSTVLYQRIQFATDVNPMARIAYGLYKGHFLNAVSVGFIPLRWENPDGTESQVGRAGPSAPSPSREAPIHLSTINSPPSTNCRRIHLEQELLEVSAVPIPANPNALALALKSGAVESGDLRDTLDLLRALCATISPTGPTGPTRPTANPASFPQILSLARALRDLLRRA